MHKIGEKVVYGSSGVMEILDVREESVLGKPRQYYVLRESRTNSSSMTYVPVDNEELVAAMRPLLTKDEIIEIIREAKSLPEKEWIEDNRARSLKFKRIISSGDRTELIAMINSIYSTGKRRGMEGKRNYLSDETAMKKAEKLIYSEFSEVLGISEEEIPEFIAKLE